MPLVSISQMLKYNLRDVYALTALLLLFRGEG
jgi:hypothetical protein